MEIQGRHNILLESRISRSYPQYLFVLMFVFGLLLLSNSLYDICRRLPPRDAISKAAVGGACLYASRFRKRIYLAPDGIVKETESWFTRNETLLPWEEVLHVTLAFRKNEMLALFERGVTGWKVPFDAHQEQALRKILKEYIPEIEVGTLGRVIH